MELTIFQAWLSAGDRIYFAVNRGENDDYFWNATEIVWTITKLDTATGSKSGNATNFLPTDFALGHTVPETYNIF